MKFFHPESVRFSCPKKTKKRCSLKISPIFGPKLGEDQKEKRSSPNLVRFLVLAYRLCAQTFCPSFKGGHAAILYANCTILATQRGGMAQCPPPLNTPLSTLTSFYAQNTL